MSTPTKRGRCAERGLKCYAFNFDFYANSRTLKCDSDVKTGYDLIQRQRGEVESPAKRDITTLGKISVIWQEKTSFGISILIFVDHLNSMKPSNNSVHQQV